jgi:T4-like virus tail tube protein gp19
MTIKRAYAAGHFEMAIDGHKTTSFLKSVEGGYSKQQVIDEPTGTEAMRIKHGGVWDIDPITIDFGLAGANEVLKWIQGSWRHDWSTRNGEIIHADFNLKQTFVQEFSDAMILETTFPTLDGSSREGAYMKVKFQPEKIVLKQKAGTQVSGLSGNKQKSWAASSFKLTIDGLSDLDKVNKIESFTIKQGVKKFYVGQDRFPTLHPTKIEYPNLVCNIAEVYAKDLLKWHQELSKGKAEQKAQLTGSLEFLSPEKKPIFRLNLYEVGLASYQVLQSTANEDKIKRVKFELFVGKMDLDGAKGLGLE